MLLCCCLFLVVTFLIACAYCCFAVILLVWPLGLFGIVGLLFAMAVLYLFGCL